MLLNVAKPLAVISESLSFVCPTPHTTILIHERKPPHGSLRSPQRCGCSRSVQLAYDNDVPLSSRREDDIRISQGFVVRNKARRDVCDYRGGNGWGDVGLDR